MLLGPLGSGKTLAGLQFVMEGARGGETGLITSFRESPERLLAKATAIGLALDRQVAEGKIQMLWHPARELLLDAWAHELLDRVAQLRPTRLVVDTLSDAQFLVPDPARLPAFTTALVSALAEFGVTTLLNAEPPTIVGGDLAVLLPPICGAVDTVVLLRYREHEDVLHRFVSMLRSGEGQHDHAVRPFVIGDCGLEVPSAIAGAASSLGSDRPVAPIPAPPN